MPKFLFAGTYTPEGMRGVIKEKASGRKAVVEGLLASLGGKLEGMREQGSCEEVLDTAYRRRLHYP